MSKLFFYVWIVYRPNSGKPDREAFFLNNDSALNFIAHSTISQDQDVALFFKFDRDGSVHLYLENGDLLISMPTAQALLFCHQVRQSRVSA